MMRSVASPLAPSRVSCGICRLATQRRPATALRRAVRSRWRRHVATSSSSSSQAKAKAIANDTKQTIVPPEEPSFALPTAFGIGTVAGALGSLAGMGGGVSERFVGRASAVLSDSNRKFSLSNIALHIPNTVCHDPSHDVISPPRPLPARRPRHVPLRRCRHRHRRLNVVRLDAGN